MLRQQPGAGGPPPRHQPRHAGLFRSLAAAGAVTVACILTVAPARAEGLPNWPTRIEGSTDAFAYDWSGLYIGAHVLPTLADDADGAIAGGHLGFNHQFAPWVIGLEASLSDGDLDSRQTSALPASFLGNPNVRLSGAALTTSYDLEGLFLATGRLGYAWDRGLAYLKGGYASVTLASTQFASGTAIVDTRAGPIPLPFEAAGRTSERHHGWTLGAGFEYALTTHILFGLEYNFIDLGSQTHHGLAAVVVAGEPLDPIRLSALLDPDGVHTLWARLSFKFGGGDLPPPPVK